MLLPPEGRGGRLCLGRFVRLAHEDAATNAYPEEATGF